MNKKVERAFQEHLATTKDPVDGQLKDYARKKFAAGYNACRLGSK